VVRSEPPLSPAIPLAPGGRQAPRAAPIWGTQACSRAQVSSTDLVHDPSAASGSGAASRGAATPFPLRSLSPRGAVASYVNDTGRRVRSALPWSGLAVLKNPTELHISGCTADSGSSRLSEEPSATPLEATSVDARVSPQEQLNQEPQLTAETLPACPLLLSLQ